MPPSDPAPPSRCHANETRLASCVEEQGRHRATDRRPVRRGWARRSGFSRQGQRAPRESVQAIIFEPHCPIRPNGVMIHPGTGPPVPTSTVDHPTPPGLCPRREGGALVPTRARHNPPLLRKVELTENATKRHLRRAAMRSAGLALLCGTLVVALAVIYHRPTRVELANVSVFGPHPVQTGRLGFLLLACLS